MRENFYAELSRRLREEGIESSYAGTQNLNVLLHGQPVLCVTPSSEIFILPAGSKNEEVNDLYHREGAKADEVYEYVEAVQSSPLLRASDLKEEFRLLADFGCAVLAGRERENGRGYQFVTWVWDFDRRGVSHGHYFEGNYHAAKEDFAVRSGLISRAQLFSADQLAELYRATDFFLEEGPEGSPGGQNKNRIYRPGSSRTTGTIPGTRNELVEQTTEGPVAAVRLQTAGPSFLCPLEVIPMNRRLFFKLYSFTYYFESVSNHLWYLFFRFLGCPYPAHGFLCWASDQECLRTRMKKINRKEESNADQSDAQ